MYVRAVMTFLGSLLAGEPVRSDGQDPRYDDVPTDARPESAIIAEILRRHHAVPDTAILIEDESTNCGENAKLSVELLKLTPWKVRSTLLIQDPTMRQRTHECFRRCLSSSVTVPIAEPFADDLGHPRRRR